MISVSRIARLVTLTVLALWGTALGAFAAEPTLDDPFRPNAYSRAEKFAIQQALAFAGYYDGSWDGSWGPASQRAFDTFAAEQAHDDKGLNSSLARAMVFRNLRLDEKRWETVIDGQVGLVFAMPRSLVDQTKTLDTGVRWYGKGISIELHLTASRKAVAALHDELRDGEGNEDLEVKPGNRWRTTLVHTPKGRTYVGTNQLGRGWVSLRVEVDVEHDDVLDLIVRSHTITSLAVVRSLEAGAPNLSHLIELSRPFSEAWALASGFTPDQALRTILKGAGTGFLINESMVVTNAHVVKDCDHLRTATGEALTVVGSDEDVDLALLELDGKREAHLSVSAAAAPRLGQRVVALGYPLYGVVGTELNLTEGVVSAENGLDGDTDFFALSASLLPGNSGGPVVGSDGRVIGVAAAILMSQVSEAGQNNEPAILIKENNYAIKAGVLRHFLDDLKIGYESAGEPVTMADGVPPSIADAVVPVLCTY